MEEERLQRITKLTERFIRSTITADEQAELSAWWREDRSNIERFVRRLDDTQVREALAFTLEGQRRCGKAWERLNERLTPVVPLQKRHSLRWCAVGTAAFVLLVTGLWSITRSGRTSPAPLISSQLNALNSSRNQAVLQLSDGSRIDLVPGERGAVVARDGGAQVVRRDSNRISYLDAKGRLKAGLYNTVSTQRGGMYQVVLPDSTVVWLNTESSLRFPTAFTGADRQVELTGEAYFEVAKDQAVPFIVRAGEMKVKVLGTHFDVQAYPADRKMQATLLEGSVAVEAAGRVAILHPGEQAAVGDRITVHQVDTDDILAWKEGFVVFNNADIETIIRQISRYYNVKVVYRGEKKDWRLTGRVSRQRIAADMLEILQANGFHFSLEADQGDSSVANGTPQRK